MTKLQLPRGNAAQPDPSQQHRVGGTNTQRWRGWLVACATAAALAACGGGGDAGPPKNYAVKAALGNLLNSTTAWTMTGTASGQSFTVTMAFAALPDAPFPVNGAPAGLSRETLTSQIGPQSSSDTLTIYFDRSTQAFIGIASDTTCAVATSNGALPVSAKTGTSGPLFDESDLNGCTSASTSIGTSRNTWSLEVDSGIVLLCWIAADPSVPSAALSQCVQVAEDGTLGSKARWSATLGGTTLTARNF